MKAELIKFRATDGTKLNGFICNYENRDTIIISTHGMGSNCFKEREFAISNLIEGTNISLLSYNNRGTEILSKMKKKIGETSESYIGGSANENPCEGYYDIKGAIELALNLGYKQIYLQGHSLGSTKTVYTYNRLLDEKYEHINKIKGIILLSLVDIPNGLKEVLGIDAIKENELNEQSEKLIAKGKGNHLMAEDVFFQPLSANTYKKLCVDNEEINFARYSDKDYKYEKLNSIKVPIFMRWGNNRELISQSAEDLVKMLKEKINNSNLDIGYIDGADHSFHGFETTLATEIVKFVNDN